MELATLFGIALAASIVWFVPISATSVVYGAELGWNPAAVGLVCASAQSLGYVVLYFGGQWLTARWSGLRRRVEETRARFSSRLEGGYLVATFVGGVTGMPPMVGLAALAPAFHVPLAHFLAAAFPARALRFAMMAAFGHGIAYWFGL